MTEQDLLEEAAAAFGSDRPSVFVDPNHCSECSEHNGTLLAHTPESISLAELGNPGWDPICFVEERGFKYYFPAMVRLALDSGDDYVSQFLFHVTSSPNCASFDERQAALVGAVLQYLEDDRWERLETHGELDALLHAKDIWAKRGAG